MTAASTTSRTDDGSFIALRSLWSMLEFLTAMVRGQSSPRKLGSAPLARRRSSFRTLLSQIDLVRAVQPSSLRSLRWMPWERRKLRASMLL